MKHAFNEATRTLSISEPCTQRRPWDGEGEDHVLVRPHKLGLRIASICGSNRTLRQSAIAPGQYSLDEVSEYIAGRVHAKPVVISDLLLETELWYDRGFLEREKHFPREIFERVPLEEFVLGSLKSYKQWLRDVLYSGPAFHGVSSAQIDRGIRDGAYPEKLHSIKHWTRIDFENLRFVARYRVWQHPGWGTFATQYYAMYSEVLMQHSEAWREADAFIRAVLRFPKTERVRDLIDRIYNEGGSMAATARFRSTGALAAYLESLTEANARAPRKGTLAQYKAPEIDVPPGWRLADKATFWALSEKFNCCISNYPYYAERVAAGDGAVAYHDAHVQVDGGALAFFFRDSGTWELDEIRSRGNGVAARKYAEEADSIVLALRRWEKEQQEAREAERLDRRLRYDRELRQRAREGGRRDRPRHFYDAYRGHIATLRRTCGSGEKWFRVDLAHCAAGTSHGVHQQFSA